MLEEYKIDPNKGEEDWWKQLMNICQSPGNVKFYESWFNSWVPRLPSNIVWSGIVIDSATKDEQVIMKGDWTAVHLGHFCAYGHLYLESALHSNSYKSPELMNALAAIAQGGRGGGVFNIVKEKVGEEMFFGMVREKFVSLGMPCTTYPCGVRGQGKKLVRIIEALQAPFMAGKIHFVGDPVQGTGYPVHIWRALVAELTHLGMWSHDDLADALSLFFHKAVRVRPTDFRSIPWEVQKNARLGQTMSRRTNAAAGGWQGRAGDIKSDGTLKDDYYEGIVDPEIPEVSPNVRVIAGDSGRETNVDPGWVARKRK